VATASLHVAGALAPAAGVRERPPALRYAGRSAEVSDTPTLLQRIGAGDRGAVAECIDHYSGLVWSLARRALPNEADAEDAVQEIFMELWRVAGRFDPGRAGEVTFVSMLARRRIADRVRRDRREPAREVFDAERHGLSEDAHARLDADLETGRPLGTVKSHLRRGMNKVRDALGTRAAGAGREHR
jgi:DNA-directed RNA polymerase specialized sigma24 family protein